LITAYLHIAVHLEDWPDRNYAQYGLPLFKATALKYDFENPIGDDLGNEPKYAA
jgi:hypothetical protein